MHRLGLQCRLEEEKWDLLYCDVEAVGGICCCKRGGKDEIGKITRAVYRIFSASGK